MPQYISLAQQGFWQPYQQLGETIGRVADRRERKKVRRQDLDWRELRRSDELDQNERENSRADATSKLNLDTGNFSLKEAKKKAGQQAALENFNINSLSVPPQFPEGGVEGPPTAPIKLDLNLPFSAQPPQIQDNLTKYAADNFLPLQALTSAFQQQQAALTGKTQMPAAPNGMVPKEYEANGFKFGPEPSGTPPKVATDSQGRDWSQDPDTGAWKLLPETRKTSEKVLGQGEVERIMALDKAEAAANNLERRINKVPNYLRGPVMGRVASVARHIPFVRGLVPTEDLATTEQAINSLIGPVFRGVQGNVGIMDKSEKADARAQGAELTDTPEVAKAKLKALREQIAEARGLTGQAFKSAGRDISGFDMGPGFQVQPLTTGQPPTFNSAQEAEAANLRPGTRVLIYNPATGKYKPAIL